MLGRLLDGRYQVVQVLSVGGFGKTYIAEDTRRPGNPKCVVKHLKPASNEPNYLQTARRLFISEAETLEQLGNHDQIPRLLAYFEENQEFFLVQEFIVGRSLSVELQPGYYWTESQVIQLLKDVLGILAFIHSYGVIHRDIKPDNLIRRASDGKLVLIDFGAVKQVRSQMTTAQNPMNATVAIGTPGYMASEQGLGRPRPSSDIYSLGIIGIQALTGLYPTQLQEDLTTGEILWQHRVQVSAGLASVLTQMVRYDYRERYESAHEALQALEQLSYSCPPTQLPSTPREALAKPSERSLVSEAGLSPAKLSRRESPVSPTEPLPDLANGQNMVRVAADSNKFPLILGGIAAVVSVVSAIAYIKSATAPPPISRQSPDSTPKVTSSLETGSSPDSTPKVTSSPETGSSPDSTPKVTPPPSITTPAASSNEFENAQFPQLNCGDSLQTNSASPIQFYPVFIKYSQSNLQTIKSNFCADAYRKTRSDTGEVAIQVASFTNRSRAELFSDFMKRKLGSGDVGQPTTFSAKPSTETPTPKNCPLVVFDPQSPLNVRSTPDAKLGKVVGKLKNGTPLSVIAEQNGWLQISSPVQGWISKSRTKTVCP
jgi:serine/threonine-protein kinase